MSRMIEQVARALCRRVLEEQAANLLAEGKGDARSLGAAMAAGVEHNWQSFEDEARAAIAATPVELYAELLREVRDAGPINPYNEHADLAERIEAALKRA